MKFARLAAVIVAALTLSACLPVTSKEPIGAGAGYAPDPALYGVWRSKASDGPGTMIFVKNDDDSQSVIVVAQGKDADSGEWELFNIKASKLGSRTYMSAREMEMNGKPADDELAGQNIPLLYKIEGKTLTLRLLDDKKVADAIKAGTIAGTIEPGENGDVRITANAVLMNALFSTDAGAALFGKPAWVMSKVE
jgi:hypothetical protein